MSRAVSSSIGSSRIATSLIASTATPPRPATMNGPNCGSSRTPRIISRPSTISWTRKPSTRAPDCSGRRAAQSCRGGVAHRCLVAQPERDAADLGLVARLRRDDLQRHRKADAGGKRCGLVRRLGRARSSAASVRGSASSASKRCAVELVGAPARLRRSIQRRAAVPPRSAPGPAARAPSRAGLE